MNPSYLLSFLRRRSMKNEAGHQEMDVINLNNFKPDLKKFTKI
jgi:hypothetical protein